MADKQDDTSPAASDNQVVAYSEMLEAQGKWWNERAENFKQYDWDGRNLRDQTTLINMVAGMEEDITFLLRYVRQLTTNLVQGNDMTTDDPDTKLRPSESPQEAQEGN